MFITLYIRDYYIVKFTQFTEEKCQKKKEKTQNLKIARF